MIELVIKNKMLARSQIVTLITDRIYYSVLPQNPTFPAISFFRVSNPRHHHIDVAYPRFQFDYWALTYSQAVELANEGRLALQREKGIFTGINVIQGVYLGEESLYEQDTKLYRISQDMKIIYRD
jgi:hypothetical protein